MTLILQPPNGLFVAFLTFLSWRFSFSDRSGGFLELGFRGDLSGIRPPSFCLHRTREFDSRSFVFAAMHCYGRRGSTRRESRCPSSQEAVRRCP